MRFRLPLALGSIMAAAMCLTACGSSLSNGLYPASQPPATSAAIQSSGQWRGIDMTGAYDVLLTIGDTAIISGDQTLTGVDLTSLSILWTIHTDWTLPIMGDATGLAVMTSENITVYDPRSGDVIGQAPLTPRPSGPGDSASPTPESTSITAAPSEAPSDGSSPSATFTDPTAPQTPPVVWESLYWAGNGLVLMGNASDGALCARAMSAPGTCLWTAPNLWTPAADFVGTSSYVIGGQWVNTGNGVVDIATGKPAPFGADAGMTPAGPIYYYGQTPDRVFRMTSPDQLQRTGPGTAQPWDTTTDAGISPAVPANIIDAGTSSSVYVATVNHADDANTVTAYSWASGQQLWTQDNLFQWISQAGLSGNIYVATVYSSATMEQDLVLLDATTGQELALYPGVPTSNSYPTCAAGNGNVYVTADLLNAYNNQSGAKEWSASMPDQPGQTWNLVVTPKHLAFLSASQNLWVLDI